MTSAAPCPCAARGGGRARCDDALTDRRAEQVAPLVTSERRPQRLMLSRDQKDTLSRALSSLSVPRAVRDKVLGLLAPVLKSVLSLGKNIADVNKSKRKKTRVERLKVYLCVRTYMLAYTRMYMQIRDVLYTPFAETSSNRTLRHAEKDRSQSRLQRFVFRGGWLRTGSPC